MSFVDQFAEKGWLKIGRVFDPSFIDALRAEFGRQFDSVAGSKSEGRRGEYLKVGDERLMLSVKLTGPFLDPNFYANPLLLKILQQLLGENLLIDNFTCVVAAPGAGEQGRHRDHSEIFFEVPEVSAHLPAYAITLVVPLIDLTPETGTTRLFPGTNRGEPASSEELPYIDRGECFLMDFRTWHQGTANRSEMPRPILYIVYSRPWFIDFENFVGQPRISIDLADAARIPRQHRPLFRRLATKGGFDLSERELFDISPSVE